MKKRLLFFLRHNNEIYHVTPIIWKWQFATDIPAVVVISNTSAINTDYRVKLLKSQENITVYLIDELIEKYESRYGESSIKSPAVLESGGQKKLNIIKKYLLRYSKVLFPSIQEKKKNKYQEHFARFLLSELMGDVDRGLVIFDWISDNMTRYFDFAKPICDKAREKGFVTVSLPHGDEPHYCRMIRKKEINYKSVDLYTRAKDLFDYIVVPNELCARRYYKHMGKDRIKILGSPRFNDEWLSKIGSLLTPYKTNGDSGKLKIVFYLRSFAYPIFWEEVVNTISLIKQFSNIYLIVVHHTRPKSLHRLTNNYPDLKPHVDENSKIINADIHSTSLIRWADVILDIGTSAVFEAIKLNRPVLELEYLHATYTTISHYMPKCVMMCRDHLYNTIKSFISNGCTNFYSNVEKEHFLKEIVDVSDSNVLDRYVRFMDRAIE